MNAFEDNKAYGFYWTEWMCCWACICNGTSFSSPCVFKTFHGHGSMLTLFFYKGDHFNLSNYCPIALTSSVSKLFESTRSCQEFEVSWSVRSPLCSPVWVRLDSFHHWLSLMCNAFVVYCIMWPCWVLAQANLSGFWHGCGMGQCLLSCHLLEFLHFYVTLAQFSSVVVQYNRCITFFFAQLLRCSLWLYSSPPHHLSIV